MHFFLMISKKGALLCAYMEKDEKYVVKERDDGYEKEREV